VRIFAFVNLYGCTIGDNSKVGTFVEIQKNAVIGRNVKISSHTFICEGVQIEDNVFIRIPILPTKLEAAITRRTKAIIPVHPYGQPADMDPINAIAAKHDIAVIEDACQAHGAKYKGRRAALGRAACFSFYPSENLGACGEAVQSRPMMLSWPGKCACCATMARSRSTSMISRVQPAAGRPAGRRACREAAPTRRFE